MTSDRSGPMTQVGTPSREEINRWLAALRRMYWEQGDADAGARRVAEADRLRRRGSGQRQGAGAE